MKAARFVVLGVALAAGGLAALLASGGDDKPAEAPKPASQIDTVDVLVAKTDITAGQSLSAQDMGWQTWPASSANSAVVKKTDKPNAIEQFTSSVSRIPIYSGEPIREGKLIKVNGSGYMAAILPGGMRAISTEISPETGAGGFILPNDRVDVIMTRRDKSQEKSGGGEVHTSETIVANVRVLAIDQTVEEKNGQKVVVGKTATIEMTQRQAEALALARQMGSVSLALRSIVDGAKDKSDEDTKRDGVNMVRFGVSTTSTPK